MKANEAGHLARVAGAAPHALIVSRLAAGAAVVCVPRARGVPLAVVEASVTSGGHRCASSRRLGPRGAGAQHTAYVVTARRSPGACGSPLHKLTPL